MALALMAGDDTTGDQPITLGQAVARIDDAITYGKLVSQDAPADHAIFAAIANAQDVRDQLQDMIPWFSAGGPTISPATSRTWAAMQGAIDGIYSAAATVTTNPDQPLPATDWASVLGTSGVPWQLIAGGAALVAVAAFAFGPDRLINPGRRRRRSRRAEVLAVTPRRVRRTMGMRRRHRAPKRRPMPALRRTQEVPAMTMAELMRQG